MKTADLLAVAAGQPQLVTAAMVKPGAVVIDVGINRLADGHLVGDVDFAAVEPLAKPSPPFRVGRPNDDCQFDDPNGRSSGMESDRCLRINH